MNRQIHIESIGHNETYVNGKPLGRTSYHLKSPDGNELMLDLDIDGSQYAIRDFTMGDLEKMLHAPFTQRPTSFAQSIINESNKHVDIPKKSSSRKNTTRRNKSYGKRSSKGSSRKRTPSKSRGRSSYIKTPDNNTIY